MKKFALLVLLAGLMGQPAGAFVVPKLLVGKSKAVRISPCREMSCGEMQQTHRFHKRRISSVIRLASVASTAQSNTDCATLQTLLSGIKAVGVGKKGSKPIPQELVPDLIEIVRQSCSAEKASRNSDWTNEGQRIRQRLASFLGTLFVKSELRPTDEQLLAAVAAAADLGEGAVAHGGGARGLVGVGVGAHLGEEAVLDVALREGVEGQAEEDRAELDGGGEGEGEARGGARQRSVEDDRGVEEVGDGLHAAHWRPLALARRRCGAAERDAALQVGEQPRQDEVGLRADLDGDGQIWRDRGGGQVGEGEEFGLIVPLRAGKATDGKVSRLPNGDRSAFGTRGSAGGKHELFAGCSVKAGKAGEL
mmetsp:Transcript_45860/g.96057  ORF Transcript_45860/g.96057 Transcript_45860/m.96057 type:complete len:364 (+) Transcript_45860:20-1111(+)